MSRLRAIFLDRDGVLNVQAPPHDYIRQPEALQILPGAAQAVARLNDAGLLVLVVTNQRGIARRMMTEDDLNAVHTRMHQELKKAGAHIDRLYVCPHDYTDNCDCRKPKPGLILQGLREFGLSLDQCLMIGDSENDAGAAKTAGIQFIRIGSDPSATDLAGAVDRIFSE